MIWSALLLANVPTPVLRLRMNWCSFAGDIWLVRRKPTEGRKESLHTLIGTLRMVIEYSKGKILDSFWRGFFDFNLKLSVDRSPQFPDYSIQYA